MTSRSEIQKNLSNLVDAAKKQLKFLPVHEQEKVRIELTGHENDLTKGNYEGEQGKELMKKRFWNLYSPTLKY